MAKRAESAVRVEQLFASGHPVIEQRLFDVETAADDQPGQERTPAPQCPDQLRVADENDDGDVDALGADDDKGPVGRFIAEPSRVLAGWFTVYDRVTGLAARTGNGELATFPTLPEAESFARRSSKTAGRNRICVVCRHRRPAADMVEGRCVDCQPDA